jgi:hypothetical protein
MDATLFAHGWFSDEWDADTVIAKATEVGAVLNRRYDAMSTKGDHWCSMTFHYASRVWQVVEEPKAARERQRLAGRYLCRWFVRVLGPVPADEAEPA